MASNGCEHHVAILAALAVANQDQVTLAVDIRQSQANDAINELNALARSELVDKEVTVRVHLAGGCPTFAGSGSTATSPVALGPERCRSDEPGW